MMCNAEKFMKRVVDDSERSDDVTHTAEVDDNDVVVTIRTLPGGVVTDFAFCRDSEVQLVDAKIDGWKPNKDAKKITVAKGLLSMLRSMEKDVLSHVESLYCG